MGFYYQSPNFKQGFYYDEAQKQGFYYQNGFYYDGFYYDNGNHGKAADGFYYDNGFYYDGFYYDQKQQKQGFYYDGFYYDQQDAFNKDNKDYWYKGEGKERMLEAINGIRTMVDHYVFQNQDIVPGKKAGDAINSIVATEVCRQVIKHFTKNVNPDEFFENGGDEEGLAVLIANEAQRNLSPAVDFTKEWRAKGSEAEEIMTEVTKELVPFCVIWKSKQEFDGVNDAQENALQTLVAKRAVAEAKYAFANQTAPDISPNEAEAVAQSKKIAEVLAKKAIDEIGA